ncbi:Eco47II family restriction endonuclease [Candidatus Tisiphia endosymbiont of Psammoecus bipunctatus]|uniref:Eco47II family restriction endonuclease n=1 Tax=Candidatus Tisiphia endosymbiont of Psammoecus bipunctatus TaxID=3139333 RepID=UPI0035C93E8A
MSYLSFIKDDILEAIVKEVFNKAANAIAMSEKKLDRNVIDPFSSLFEMSSLETDAEGWLAMEKVRQAQKTLSNHIGHFHQSVIGAINGWTNLRANQQIDLINEDRQIIAEIKNKHNTIKGSDRCNTYTALEGLVMPKGHKYKGYTAYYVAVIPKTAERYDKEFTPSISKTTSSCSPNHLIREIDGYSFYALASGVEDAMSQTFDAIMSIVAKLKPHYKVDDKFIRGYFNKAFMPQEK